MSAPVLAEPVQARAGRLLTDWSRTPLSADNVGRIYAGAWPRFGPAVVVAIAEGWNAGVQCREMAGRLECGTQSVAMTLGQLARRGVTLRLDPRSPKADRRSALTPEQAAILQQASEQQLARLRRLAPFDMAARRCLELIEVRA